MIEVQPACKPAVSYCLVIGNSVAVGAAAVEADPLIGRYVGLAFPLPLQHRVDKTGGKAPKPDETAYGIDETRANGRQGGVALDIPRLFFRNPTPLLKLLRWHVQRALIKCCDIDVLEPAAVQVFQ